jgi:aspartyl/asparaginyl-tRNA synthetase
VLLALKAKLPGGGGGGKQKKKQQQGKKGNDAEKAVVDWRATPLRERLRNVAETQFARVTYTDAIALLEKAIADGIEFAEPVTWGIDLSR